MHFVVDLPYLNLWHIKCTIACIYSLPLLFQQMTEEHFTKTVIPFERLETFRSKDIHIVFNVDVTGGDCFQKGAPTCR